MNRDGKKQKYLKKFEMVDGANKIINGYLTWNFYQLGWPLNLLAEKHSMIMWENDEMCKLSLSSHFDNGLRNAS